VLRQIIKEPEVDKMKTERDSSVSIPAETIFETGFPGSPFAKEYFTFVICLLKKSIKGC
jgi:hypothetical protein